MPYEFYKVLHLLGIFLAVASLAGAGLVASGGRWNEHPRRRLVSAVHGVAVLVVLVSGFGMLARLGLTSGLPGWALAKLGIWLLIGGMLVVPRRRPELGLVVWVAAPLLAVLAGWLAVTKPF